jgi:hypothetical protein
MASPSSWSRKVAKLQQNFNSAGISLFLQIVGSNHPLALPHVSVPDISHVDWEALAAAGFRGCVFDKDNTICRPFALEVDPKLQASMERCKARAPPPRARRRLPRRRRLLRLSCRPPQHGRPSTTAPAHGGGRCSCAPPIHPPPTQHHARPTTLPRPTCPPARPTTTGRLQQPHRSLLQLGGPAAVRPRRRGGGAPGGAVRAARAAARREEARRRLRRG